MSILLTGNAMRLQKVSAMKGSRSFSANSEELLMEKQRMDGDTEMRKTMKMHFWNVYPESWMPYMGRNLSVDSVTRS